MRRHAWIGPVALMVFVACGPVDREPSLGAVPSISSAPQTSEGWGSRDWDDPILGDTVQTANDASQVLGFSPLIPSGLGTPSKILVQSGREEIKDRQVAFLYDHSTYGRVVVIEFLPDIKPAKYLELLESIPAQVAEVRAGGASDAGFAELISIRNGITALMSQPPDRSVTGLRWIEDGLVIDIDGPELQKDEVVAIANAL